MSDKASNFDRDPSRLEFPLHRWAELSQAERDACYAKVDHEIDEVGIVVIAGALSNQQCDEFWSHLQYEMAHPAHIEKVMWERRWMHDGYKIYNLTARHPDFLELITFPFTVGYMRRHLGANMIIHSSEAAVIPPGGGDLPPGTSNPTIGWHTDAWDRIPNYFLSINSIYYLVDTSIENGATRYIPGTHKEFISLAEAIARPCRYCCVKKGDVVIFNPYLYHCGSPNNSKADRPIIINYYQRFFIRQEMDYFRQRSVPEIRRMTPEQRLVLGYKSRMLHDINEVYFRRPEMADFDPVGKLD